MSTKCQQANQSDAKTDSRQVFRWRLIGYALRFHQKSQHNITNSMEPPTNHQIFSIQVYLPQNTKQNAKNYFLFLVCGLFFPLQCWEINTQNVFRNEKQPKNLLSHFNMADTNQAHTNYSFEIWNFSQSHQLAKDSDETGVRHHCSLPMCSRLAIAYCKCPPSERQKTPKWNRKSAPTPAHIYSQVILYA